MATYHIEPNRTTLHGHFSRDLSPVLTIESGDTVIFRTLDAGWSVEPQTIPAWNQQPRKFEPRDPEKDGGHALCGPVFITGAEPGMTLEIGINSVIPGSWGWTAGGDLVNERLGIVNQGAWLLWSLDANTMTGKDQFAHTVRLRPFMGVMGMPPNESGTLPTFPPRVTGGNLDCKELVAGSHLFLPIAVPGGLFSCGDGHAAQGDGEVSGTAIECPMEQVSLTFHLHAGAPIKTPRARTAEGWLTLGLHTDLREATMIALNAMLDLLKEQHPGIERAEALALASVAVDMRITQLANDTLGVHAFLPHGAIQ